MFSYKVSEIFKNTFFYRQKLSESLFSKVAGRKDAPTKVLSYAYCEFFNNIYFLKHLRTAASDYSFTIAAFHTRETRN